MSSSFQSMLAVGALAIFSLVSLRFNTSVLENMNVEVENKVYLTAFSLADDMIEEIKQKAFDEKTVDWKAISTSNLTPWGNFGPDSGEVSSVLYDDIDDYDGYERPVSLPHAEGYVVKCGVSYVIESDPNSLSNFQTYYKKVDVTVTSKYLIHPVKLSFVFTLHSK